ncbi:hypothetical protein L1887_28489 [Cichorium endivia]|nr:hypothetical protein L1887_28489 [Cichorium endivia]
MVSPSAKSLGSRPTHCLHPYGDRASFSLNQLNRSPTSAILDTISSLYASISTTIFTLSSRLDHIDGILAAIKVVVTQSSTLASNPPLTHPADDNTRSRPSSALYNDNPLNTSHLIPQSSLQTPTAEPTASDDASTTIPFIIRGHFSVSNSDDDEVTAFDLEFLNDKTNAAVPLAITYLEKSKGRQAMYEESSSEKYQAPFKKCFIDDQLQARFKNPKESSTPNGELIIDEDLPIIVAKLQISVEESRTITKDQNKFEVNEIITKQSEDLI